MKKTFLKIISIFLSVLMIVSCMPLVALAGNPYGIRSKDMSESGTNEFCTWSYDSDTKTLYIDGEIIDTKDNFFLPAYSYLNEYNRVYCWMGFEHLVFGKNVTYITNIIMDDVNYPNLKTVEFEQGSKLEAIGDLIFECSPLEKVALPDGLKEIGDNAFAGTNLTEISIPTSVNTLGAGAIAGCPKLAKIDFNNRKTPLTVGSGTFSETAITSFDFNDILFDRATVPVGFLGECPNLTDVTLTDSITTIGAQAFLGCSSLKSIDLKNVTALNSGAFESSGIESISSSKVKKMASDVFWKCESLTSASFPNLTTMGKRDFEGCTMLRNVSIPKVQLLDKSTFKDCKSLKAFDFSNVNDLDDGAFQNSGLVSADLSNVTCIGYGVFDGCSNLESVKFSDYLSVIESYAFNNCEKLDIPQLPNSVREIGDSAFAGTATTTATLKDGVVYGAAVYENCKMLNTASIDAGVKEIPPSTFQEDTALATVNIAENSTLTSIGMQAFMVCSALEDIAIPNTVTDIGNFAFAECSSLRDVLLYPSVANIGNSAFKDCKSLNKVIVAKFRAKFGSDVFENSNPTIYGATDSYAEKYAKIYGLDFKAKGSGDLSEEIDALIEDVTDDPARIYGTWQYGTWRFSSDESVLYIDGDGYVSKGASGNIVSNTGAKYTSFTYLCYYYGIKSVDMVFGEGITQIASNIISGSSNVTVENLTLPNSLVEIDDKAFFGINIRNVMFGTGLKKIGDSAFSGCGVKNIGFDKGCALEYVGFEAFKKNNLTKFNFPTTVTYFGDNAFDGAKFQNETIDLSGFDTNTKFGAYMFQNAQATSVNLGSAQEIETGMFKNCWNLESVTIPNTVELICDNAFSGCSHLQSITIPDSVRQIYSYAFASCSNLENVTLPDNMTSLPGNCFSYAGVKNINLDNITSIGSYCFEHCSRLETVNLPKATKLSVSVFKACQNLKSVSIPKVTSIPSNTFDTCPYLVELDAPNVTSVGAHAFDGCTSFSDFDLDSPKLTKIYDYAFKNTAYTNVTLHGNKEYGQYCFANCVKLKDVVVEKEVTVIPLGTFEYCGALTYIDFESGSALEIIGAYAFRYCHSITRIVLPPNVKSVNTYTFGSCSNLQCVVLSNKVENISSNAFYSDSNLKYLVIPKFAVKIDSTAIPKTTTVISSASSSANEYCTKYGVNFVPSVGAKYISEYPALSFVSSYNRNGDYSIEDRSEGTYGTWKNGVWGYSADQSILTISGTGTLTNTFKDAAGNDTLFATILSRVAPNQALTVKIGGGITGIAKDFANGEDGYINYLFIQEGVTTIGDNAFKGLGIYTLNLKDDVTTIGAHAFDGCQLYSVNYNDTIKMQTIGDYAFANNDLRGYIGTITVKSIGAHAYENNNVAGFYGLGREITVGDYAFNNNVMGTVEIGPDNVIGDYAFANASHYEIKLTASDGVTTIPNGAFVNCRNLKELSLPDSVKVIGDEAFMGTGIKTAELGGEITTIKSKAFYGCESLKTVSIGENVRTIGASAFGDCFALSDVYFGNNTASIYSDTVDKSNCAIGFNSAGAIIPITRIQGNINSTAYRYAYTLGIPFVAVNSVGDECGYIADAPEHCLQELCCKWEYYKDSDVLYIFGKTTMAGDWRNNDGQIIDAPKASRIVISSGVTGLATSFANTGVKEITIPNSVTDIYDCFRNCDKLEYVNIPNTVQTMNNYTFKGCKSLKSLSLGTGLNSIPDYCAADCTNLKYLYLYGAQTIGEYSFKNCSSLQTITIPDTVRTIRRNAFENCYSVFNVQLGEGLRTISSKAFANLLLLDTITYTGSVDSVSTDAFANSGSNAGGIDVVLGDNVVYANVNGFSNIDVKTITIGERFKEFANSPNIPSLKEYKINDTNANGYEVYKSCLYKDNAITNVPQALDSIEIKQGITAIGDYAFAYSRINTIRIPEGVKAVGDYAFYMAQNLKTVRFPSTVYSIGNSAFEHCVKLKTVSIPYPCRSIGDRAFNQCTLLASILLPESLESVGASCFSECDSLESIVFPESVQTIGSGALAFCSNLKSVYVWYADFDQYIFYGSSIPTVYTMAGSNAHGIARTKKYPFSAYTSEESFADLCFEMMDILSGYLGYCTDGHGDIEWLTVYDGDCENDGYQIGVCEYCSEILDERHTYANGHEYTQLVYKEATETDYGIRVLRCNNCDTRFTSYYEPLGQATQGTGLYNVCGKIAADTGIENSKENTAIENVEIVINGDVVAKTDEAGHFNFKMKSGIYMVEVRYIYGFTRYLALSITDHDVLIGDDNPIKIVACDFNKDGIIDAADQTLFTLVTASKEGDVSYLKAVDINNDGYINARDYVIIGRFKGQTASTYQYPDFNMS